MGDVSMIFQYKYFYFHLEKQRPSNGESGKGQAWAWALIENTVVPPLAEERERRHSISGTIASLIGRPPVSRITSRSKLTVSQKYGFLKLMITRQHIVSMFDWLF